MLCEKCGREVNYHATFCLHCGAKQERPAMPTIQPEPMNPITPTNTQPSDDHVVTALLQEAAYKIARRKLTLRIGSIALFLIISLFSAIGDFGNFLTFYLPVSFWGSLFVTYLLGDGIRGVFEKIGTAIASVIAWILAFFVYGILLVVVLAGIAIGISLIFEAMPTILLAIVLGVAWYGGVILSAVFGIRNYLDMTQYKDAYQQTGLASI